MQTWPQPLLQHLWPQGHSSSKLHRSRQVPPSLGRGHTPTLPARQAPSWGAAGWEHPTVGHPRAAPQGFWETWLALTSRDVHADAATAGAGAPLSLRTLPVSFALVCTLATGPVLALCRGTVTRGHLSAPGGWQPALPGQAAPATSGHGHALPAAAGVAALLLSLADTVVQALAPASAPGVPAWLYPGALPGVLCRRRGPDRGCGVPHIPAPLTHLCPVLAAGLPALTSGRAGAVHGAAREAALLLPGTVPVVGAGVHLCAQLRRLLWPQLWALARFV